MQLKFIREISKVLVIVPLLALIGGCQYWPSSSAINAVPASSSPIPGDGNGNIHEQNISAEPCIPHITNARTLRLAGKTEEAAAEFQKAIGTGCGEIEIRRELGEMYRAKGRFDESINEYQRLLNLDNKDIRAHWALADIFILDTKNYQAGLDQARLAEQQVTKGDYTGRRRTYLQIGRANDGLGNIILATKYYKEFLKGCSKTPDSNECKEIKSRLFELGGQV